MRSIVIVLMCIAPLMSYGIVVTTKNLVSPAVNEEEPRVPGYVDTQGLKQGWFVIYGKDMPEKTEYPPEGKIEEGNYKDDRKVGEWIIYHYDGKTPRLKGTFVDGRPNGPYKKFGSDGKITEEGASNKGKQLGVFTTYYPGGGGVKQQKTFNAEGKEEGPVTFFYESGQVQVSCNMVNGVKTGEEIRYWEDGSVKEIVLYNSSGEPLSTTVVNEQPPVAVAVVNGSGGPDGSKGLLLDGKEFHSDGYNKLYNKAKDLWMDGEFKSGKLWNGELYKYDSDGILMNIEIWKNGSYHSDGHL